MKIRLVQLFLAIMLLIALLETSTDYDRLLRLAVFIGAAFLINKYNRVGLLGWIIPFSIIAILWNPFIPIYLNSNISIFLYGVTSLIFTISALTPHRRR